VEPIAAERPGRRAIKAWASDLFATMVRVRSFLFVVEKGPAGRKKLPVKCKKAPC
jgi:hypothetical protein